MALLPLEAEALARFREGRTVTEGASAEEWALFSLVVLLQAVRTIRSHRIAGWPESEIDIKSDGSPATEIDSSVERALKDSLARFAPDAVLVGEETGGQLPESGMGFAVDPIDGTWAFITATSTAATALALFRDGVPWLGFVGNPATGEVAYTHPEGGARLVQIDLFGEGDRSESLPLVRGNNRKILVNTHPSRATAHLERLLHDAWADGGLRMVRASGGSPSWALVEAAKGQYTYVNPWAKAPAEEYDLAAGALILRAAGGDIVDDTGAPVVSVGHEGAFVASISDAARATVCGLVREAASKTLRTD